jgi:hypothetical protein
LVLATVMGTAAVVTLPLGALIVISIGECAQFIVLGPLVADLAPPHLLGHPSRWKGQRNPPDASTDDGKARTRPSFGFPDSLRHELTDYPSHQI